MGECKLGGYKLQYKLPHTVVHDVKKTSVDMKRLGDSGMPAGVDVEAQIAQLISASGLYAQPALRW